MKLAVLTAAVVLLTSPVAWTYDLSKAETAANVPDSGNQGATFPVDSTEPAWQNSGVWVKAGQHVEVEANPKDLWDIGWGPTTAAGYPEQHDPNGGLPQYHLGKMNTDWHYGALICAVGKDRKEGKDPQNEVEIGMKRGFTVDRDGWLYFICNDNDAAPATGLPGYGDNSGIVHIRITVKDHAPSTGATPNIFDAQSDFSGAKNPHGVWTYGWTDELNGKLHVYGDTYVKYDGTDWTDDTILDSGAPQLAYHPRFFPEDNHIPAKVMLIHPGPQGEYSHCRCTIPKAGMYDIDASFAALDIGDPHV
ncbi:MAG TPA: hypothetical protein VHY22_09860, partial [Chthoniobacteraceae bacterium]|nr:hypothetical protein [Chthoniobacteraceae bacterium]